MVCSVYNIDYIPHYTIVYYTCNSFPEEMKKFYFIFVKWIKISVVRLLELWVYLFIKNRRAKKEEDQLHQQ